MRFDEAYVAKLESENQRLADAWDTLKQAVDKARKALGGDET